MDYSNIFIISGPSGAGEDSIISELRKRLDTEKIITSTTRPQRTGEIHGQDYYFISKDQFETLISAGLLYEYAQQYNGEFYGVTVDEIERVAQSDRIGLWKIDYKGVINAKQSIPGIIAIFIDAPIDALESRIRRRDNVEEDYIQERMTYTREWLEHTDIYDYRVENLDGELIKAVDNVERIIKRHYGHPEATVDKQVVLL